MTRFAHSLAFLLLALTLAACGQETELSGARQANGIAQGSSGEHDATAPEPDADASERPTGPVARKRGRVLLIGIDGASPRVVDKLIDMGELPNLAELAAHGVYGPLRSFAPYFSPRIWNTIATGKNPMKHGIHFFTWKDENKEQRLYLSSHRKAHALWNIASDAQLSVGVVNWWTTYPPEKIDGVMVSDHALPGVMDELRARTGLGGPRAPVAYPESWGPRAAEMLADADALTSFDDPFADPDLSREVDLEALSRAFREDAAVVKIALAIDEELEPDVLMVLMSGIDRSSHWLWSNLEPIAPGSPHPLPKRAERQAGSRALLAYYGYTDALIGLLAGRFSHEDLVMVVSDHGFEQTKNKHPQRGTHWSKASQDGVLFARGSSIAKGASAGAVTVNDVTPTILAWLGLPVAEDMDGKPASFVQTSRPPPIESYTGPIERAEVSTSGAEGEILERLRAIGYIDE